MNLLKRIALLPLFIAGLYTAHGQANVRDSCIFVTQLQFGYGFHIPGGDLSNRFGFNHSIAFSPTIKTGSNWLFGLDAQFHFGNQVKETSMLDGLKTSQGLIIGQDGIPAEVFFYQRGYNFNLNFGKLFSLLSNNPNSGILAKIGVGYFQHKIRLEDRDRVVPQLRDDYLKGYDRLTSGLGITGFIGYQQLSNRRLVNFFGGFEFTQAFTQGRRDHQFDTNAPYHEKRIDMQWGFRAGWIFPIYKRAPEEYYYF